MMESEAMVAEMARQRNCLAGYDEGLLKTFLDGQLPEAWRDPVSQHTKTCPACVARLARLRLDGALVRGRLASLDGVGVMPAARPRPPVATVLAMARRPVRRQGGFAAWWQERAPQALAGGSAWRPAPLLTGIAAGVVLAFGAALSQPAVQSFAQGALQQFRVQRVQPVQLDVNALRASVDKISPAGGDAVGAFFRAGTYVGPTEPKVRVASVADANRATGMTVRGVDKLPDQVKGGPSVLLSDPASFTFTYNGEKLVQVANEAGVADAALLAQLRTLDGVTVKGTIPAAAAVVYGSPFPEGAAPVDAGRQKHAARAPRSRAPSRRRRRHARRSPSSSSRARRSKCRGTSTCSGCASRCWKPASRPARFRRPWPASCWRSPTSTRCLSPSPASRLRCPSTASPAP
jgi:anti-sigma factor RsiW